MTFWTSILLLFAVAAGAQPAAKFEVASVKLRQDCPQGGRGGRVGGESVSPAALHLRCETVINLIRLAYVSAMQPVTAVPTASNSVPISGGPPWISSERYDIDAEAEGAPGLRVLRGPMLQALLKDRFQLKLHRESSEVPVFEVTLGKGGIRSVQPAERGKCITYDLNSTDPRPKPGEGHLCGLFYPAGDHNTEVYGITMADLCRQFSQLDDRPYIDKTGLTDKYDIRFENSESPFSPAGGHSALIDLMADHLNLKIQSAKGAQERMVIDRVERPSGN